MSDFDASLMQDFLTESGELIEQLDADLVKLESAEASEQGDLLNASFRALHTIKGAASFLGLETVIRFAHVAEDALNRLRKGEIGMSIEVMDALLQSADVVRNQIDQLSEGLDAQEAPAELVAQLQAIIDNKPAAANQPATGKTPAEDGESAPNSPEVHEDGLQGNPLLLPPQKQDLLEFMVADMQDYAGQLDEVIDQLGNDATREEAATQLTEIADNLSKTADFFELDGLNRAIKLLTTIATAIGETPHDLLGELVVRVRAIKWLIDEQTTWLEKERSLDWELDTLTERVESLCKQTSLPADVAGAHQSDPIAALLLDGVIDHDPSAAIASEPEADIVPETETPPAAQADAEQAPAPASEPTQAAADTETPAAPASQPAEKSAPDKAAPTAGKQVAEQTIRVEVGRLESLLNLVGQLVLNKNRVLAQTRMLEEMNLEQDKLESFNAAAGELDRLTGELQVSVMRTRMQPLAKLFDRYPRVIRDLARQTGKQIDLELVGKETEVDKTVLENLSDPLVHILRNSADHGVEMPEDRKAANKNPKGKIRLEANHQGSHVRVAIIDDGKGLDRDVIGKKAIEKGITTPEQLEKLDDSDVFRFIFEAGFSTAAQVSDLSGRGVGMDVVRTNINKLNGTININSAKGKGTTIEILIPLTVAIMPAMIVEIGQHLYSIPLQSIEEIVRPEEGEVSTIRGQRVMRLRDSVLPLTDMRDRLNESGDEPGGRFAVVVAVGGQRAGLCVDRLIGQQEIVIKPLDDSYTQGGPFSGATIREDGRVSLILDVVQLIRQTPAALEKRAA
ncbi:MAG: chemotaxis protein CheW [Phycisphaeraceae bacterium]